MVIVLKGGRHLCSVKGDLSWHGRGLLLPLHAVGQADGAGVRAEAGSRRGCNTVWSLGLDVRTLAGEWAMRSCASRLMLRSRS